jgi:hypothetical protein
MRQLLLLALLTLFGLSSVGNVLAQTPPDATRSPAEPTPPLPPTRIPVAPGAIQTPAVTTGSGLRHSAQVFDRQAIGQSPEGAIILVRRLLTPQEVQELQGRKLGICGQANVSGGRAEIIPQFSADCPEGSNVGISVVFSDGELPVAAETVPPIEWRRARAGEATREIIIKPDQPRTADGDPGQSQVRPPATGDAALVSRETRHWEYGGIALGLLLLITGGLMALKHRQLQR